MAHCLLLCDGPVTALPRRHATAGERESAYPSGKAHEVLRRICSESALTGRRQLLQMHELLFGQELLQSVHLRTETLVEQLLEAAASGELLLVAGWHGFPTYRPGRAAPARQAPSSLEYRVVQRVMAGAQGPELVFEGSRYVVIAAPAWGQEASRYAESFEVVRREEAFSALGRMARRATSEDEREALAEAASKLADTQVRSPREGIFLLRRRLRRDFAAAQREDEAPITPSQSRKAAQDREEKRDLKIHYQIDTSVPEAKDDKLILETEYQEWVHEVEVGSLPEIEPGWVEAVFPNPPKGARFNLIQDHCDGGEPHLIFQGIPYDELFAAVEGQREVEA